MKVNRRLYRWCLRATWCLTLGMKIAFDCLLHPFSIAWLIAFALLFASSAFMAFADLSALPQPEGMRK